MLLEMSAVSIIGGFICLDRSCLQLMVSRPIVIAPLTGLFLGDIVTGLTIGAFTELLWLDKPQIGIYVPPNDSLIAVAMVSSLLLSGATVNEHRQEATVFAFLALMPLGLLTKIIDSALIEANEKLSATALDAGRAGDMDKIKQAHFRAIGRSLLVNIVFLIVAITAGLTIIRFLFPLLPDQTINALKLMYHLIPAVLIAVALNTIKLKKMVPIFCALFLAALMIVEILNGF